MKTIQIVLPDNVEGLAAPLKAFVDAMVYKLAKNAHKGKWEGIPLTKALELLDGEVVELKEAFITGNTIEIMLESSDVANFALMAANIAIRDAGA